MYPDLLGIFGIQLYGRTFETAIWIIGLVLMAWGIVSSIGIFRCGRRAEALIQGAVAAIAASWLAGRLLGALGDGGYVPFFDEPIVLHTYAFMILVGIACGTATVVHMAPSFGLERRETMVLVLSMVLSGLAGARLAHVLVEWPQYVGACFGPDGPRGCLRVFDLSEGGLTFYGGVLSGFAVLAVFVLRRRRAGNPVSLLSLTDLLAPALAVAHCCGRIGCLAAGCCWGAVSASGWGIRYPADSFAALWLSGMPEYSDAVLAAGITPPLHPTQIYEAAAELLLYAALWVAWRRRTATGRMTALWFVGYGMARFVVEIMRDDPERGFLFEKVVAGVNSFFDVSTTHTTLLSTSQGIALAMMAFGVYALIRSAKDGGPLGGHAEAAARVDSRGASGGPSGGHAEPVRTRVA